MLERKKLTLDGNEKCKICGESLLNEGKDKLNFPVLSQPQLGTVHQKCFFPYHQEGQIKLLIKIRCYSIGDAIATTPIIREYKRIYPNMHIGVMTFFPDLFEYNPAVNSIIDLNEKIFETIYKGYHFTTDAFDEDKGLHFAMHSVDYSAICAMGRTILPNNWHYEIYYSPEDRNRAIEICKENGIDVENDKCILIHPHRTEWPTRDWGPKHFPVLAKKLKKRYPDYKLVSIGGKRSEAPKYEMKNYIEIEDSIDLYSKLTLLQSLALMDLKCMKLIITPDTGTLHMAASRPDLPIVGIFTLIKSYFRTPTRKGRFGYKFIGVESDDMCNCTYNAKLITHEMQLKTCPKRKFLEDTDRMSIPKPIKREGLKNLFPENDWESGKLGEKIKETLKRFPSDNLPCFPSVDKVLAATERLLNE